MYEESDTKSLTAKTKVLLCFCAKLESQILSRAERRKTGTNNFSDQRKK